ncbi:uncharacterized protein LOC129919850 [Episyrphus balteatus]|uniref:uncharacterized protein LOC129919850 n=1 Tax=Episyrphus balteatus TaxID=286459 RepID=UPI00248514EA|nr:uncharacterized protein LOC129919850 [Episyrphus balteatus]
MSANSTDINNLSTINDDLIIDIDDIDDIDDIEIQELLKNASELLEEIYRTHPNIAEIASSLTVSSQEIDKDQAQIFLESLREDENEEKDEDVIFVEERSARDCLKMKKVDKSVVKTELICSICLESVSGRQPTSTLCGHVFCEACILHAIQLTKKCPLCNAKLENTNLQRLYF